jgi:hypothetical protein
MIGGRLTNRSTPLRPTTPRLAGRHLLAFWLLIAFGAGMFLGSGLTVLAALLIDGAETLAGWL